MTPALRRVLFGRAPPPVSPPASTTIMNVADKSADITVDGTGLVIGKTGGVAWRAIRSVASFTTQLIYFEVTYTAKATAVCIGVGNSSVVLTNFPGNAAGTDGVGYPSNDGHVYYNGGSTLSIPGAWATVADVGCCAVNGTTRKFWFRKGPSGLWNNNGSADPATGVGGHDLSGGGLGTGALFAMVAINNTGDVATVNFGAGGAGSFSGSVPSGYGFL